MTSNAKMIGLNGQEIMLLSEDARLYALSEQQISAILSMIVGLHWKTRWENPPSKDEIEAFASETEFNLMNPLDICALIADCIESKGDVYNLIVKYGGGGQGSYPITTTLGALANGAENRTFFDLGGGSCDYNAVYGACWALTNWLNQNNLDFLEEISAGDMLYQNASKVVSAIPFLNQGSADEILEWTAEVVENILANYTSAITEGYLREISCDFFCIAIENCKLDLSDVMGYFAGKVSINAYATTVVDLIGISLGLGASNPLWFDYFAYLSLSVLAMRSAWLNHRTLDPVYMAIRAGLNDDDPDWSIYCDDCAPDGCFLPFSDLTLNQTIEFDCISVINGYFVAGDATHHAEYRDAALNPRNVELDYEIADDGIMSVFVSMRLVVLENNRHYWRVACYDASNNIVSDTGLIQRDDVSPVMVSTTRNSSGGAIKKVKLQHYRVSGANGAYYGIREVTIS